MMSETVPTPEILLEHQDWLRMLARRLVQDPATADDAVQETMTAALTHGRPVRHVQGWLATVLRNRVRDRVRSHRRREARERGAAVPEAISESPVDVVERAELAQKMTTAVLALDEPFRSTVLLRYFDGMSNEEIARRHDVPAATVRTRLKRALDRLRARFDADHDGDRKRWAGPMALAFGVESSAAVTGAGSAVGAGQHAGRVEVTTAPARSSLSWGAAIAATAVIAIVTTMVVSQIRPSWFGVDSARETGVARHGLDEGAARAPRLVVPSTAPPEGPMRTGAPLAGDTGPERDAVAAPTVEPVTVELTGRVIDVAGQPLGGIELVVGESRASNSIVLPESPGVRASIVSRADGSFGETLEGIDPRVTLLVSAREPDWETVGTATVDPNAPRAALVIAGEVTVVAGHVHDGAGRPVEGVAVQLELDEWRRNAANDPSNTRLEILHTTTNDHGEFVFDRVPDGRGRKVTAHAADRARSVEVVAGDVLGVQIEFDPNRDRTKVDGFVIDEHGFAVEDAMVVHGRSTARTDHHGRFVLSVPVEPEPSDRLLAVADGYWPTVASEEWDRTKPIELRLEQRPLELSGTLEPPATDSAEDFEIVLVDPTPMGGWKTLEEWAAKRREFAVGPDGSFRVTGLADRPYTLRFRNRRTYLEFEVGPFAPSGVPLDITSPDDPYRTVHGVVVGLDGAPIPGVEIHRAVEHQLADGDTVTEYLDVDVTDAEGRFVVEQVTRRAALLQAEGPTIVPVRLDLAADETQVEYVLARRCGIRIANANPRDMLEVLDADGEELELHLITAGSRTSSRRMSATQGVITVAETGVRVRFLRNGKEVETVEVKLEPGTVTEIAGPR